MVLGGCPNYLLFYGNIKEPILGTVFKIGIAFNTLFSDKVQLRLRQRSVIEISTYHLREVDDLNSSKQFDFGLQVFFFSNNSGVFSISGIFCIDHFEIMKVSLT